MPEEPIVKEEGEEVRFGIDTCSQRPVSSQRAYLAPIQSYDAIPMMKKKIKSSNTMAGQFQGGRKRERPLQNDLFILQKKRGAQGLIPKQWVLEFTDVH